MATTNERVLLWNIQTTGLEPIDYRLVSIYRNRQNNIWVLAGKLWKPMLCWVFSKFKHRIIHIKHL